MDASPWAIVGAVLTGVVGWVGALITARSNRISRRLELTSPTYAALEARTTKLEKEAGERHEEMSNLRQRVEVLIVENSQLKTVVMADKRRETELESRVSLLQSLVRSVLDGVAEILDLHKDQQRLAPDGLDRLAHLLRQGERTAGSLLDVPSANGRGHR